MKVLLLIATIAIVLWLISSRLRSVAPGQADRLGLQPLEVLAGQAALTYPGRRMILFSAAIAAGSLTMNWASFLFLSRTGLELGLVALVLLWVYPVVVATARWRMSRRVGQWCASLSILAAAVALFKAKHVSVLGLSLDVAGVGGYLYLAASIALLLGVHRYVSIHGTSVS